jgi:hypothetical protein
VSTSRRPERLLAALLAAASLTLVGCGGSVGSAVTAPVVTADGTQRVELGYAGGEVTGGTARYRVPLGSTVEIVVASDVADEVHLHGYDRSGFVTAGASTTLRFVADVPGVFEVELEQRDAQLARLEVS